MVSAMKKGKQGSHKGELKEVLSGTHLDLVAESEGRQGQQATRKRSGAEVCG